jgi:hypothetical protein
MTSPPMIASVGASRIRIAVLIVAEISSWFSALATLALHIGQASVGAAAATSAATLNNKKFAKRLSLISPPVKDKGQQVNPEAVHKMPV